MGFGIAKSCIDNGHKVWGFDISRRTINKFKKIGGAIDTFDKIAKNLDMVFLVVLNAKQVKSIFTKEWASSRISRHRHRRLGSRTQKLFESR